MRTGERNIYILIGVMVIAMMAYRGYQELSDPDRGIPFYTTASPELKVRAEKIYKDNKCSDCHALWMVRNMMATVPAPALDGIGMLRDEGWLYSYLSAVNPQTILPSRLREEFKMPSFANLPDDQRKTLASYLASLKVENWYLEEVKKAEYKKLTGESLKAADE